MPEERCLDMGVLVSICAQTFLPLASPIIGEAEIAEVVDSLRSGWITAGPKVKRFERALEEHLGAAHVRCVSSCTAALSLALRDRGGRPGRRGPRARDDVHRDGERGRGGRRAPGPRRLRARDRPHRPRRRGGRDHAADAGDRAGAPRGPPGRPRRASARCATGTASPSSRTRRTRWGRGGTAAPIGTHGNLAAFSFYATKNVTTAEGGALATDNPCIAREVERLALHGLSLGAWQRYGDAGFRHFEVASPGIKANMTDLSASIGLHQLAAPGGLDGPPRRARRPLRRAARRPPAADPAAGRPARRATPGTCTRCSSRTTPA